MRLLGISGSLRRESFNTRLLQEAARLAADIGSADALEIEVATLHGIPLYNADDEAENGFPQPVVALKEKVVACDGLLLSTPEYNSGIPGVFKNAIDWLSRPNADIARVFGGKPVALIGASPGGFGTISAQMAWLPVLRVLKVNPWYGAALRLSRAGSAFGADGRLLDEAQQIQLRDLMAGFAAFCRASKEVEACSG